MQCYKIQYFFRFGFEVSYRGSENGETHEGFNFIYRTLLHYWQLSRHINFRWISKGAQGSKGLVYIKLWWNLQVPARIGSHCSFDHKCSFLVCNFDCNCYLQKTKERSWSTWEIFEPQPIIDNNEVSNWSDYSRKTAPAPVVQNVENELGTWSLPKFCFLYFVVIK